MVPRWVVIGAVLVLALGLPGAAGCVRYLIPEGDLERLEKGQLLPGEAVFICHAARRPVAEMWPEMKIYR